MALGKMTVLVIAAFSALLISQTATAHHLRSDGNGGFFTEQGHIRSDGRGGFFTPDEHVRSDGRGGFFTEDGHIRSDGNGGYFTPYKI